MIVVNNMSEKSQSELYNLAMAKLKKDRSKFTKYEIAQIEKILIEHVVLGFQPVSIQIHRDIKTGYNKYDSLAMWINSLFKDESKAIREIVKVVGGIE